MDSRSTDALARRVVLLTIGVAVVSVTAILAVVPWLAGGSHAWAETQSISDGATARAPDRVKVGGTIRITGKRWTTPSGGGSVIAIKLDDGAIEPATSVTNPATDDPVSDPEVVAAIHASAKGSFVIEVPVPEHADWTAGTRHSVRLLSGRLLNDDATRSVALTFDLVPGAARPSARPTSAGTTAAPTSDPTPSATGKPTVEHKSKAADDPTAPPSASASPRLSASASSSSNEPVRPASTTPAATAESTATLGARRNAPLNQGSDPGTGSERAAGSPEKAEQVVTCEPEPAVTLSSQTTVRGVPVADLGGTLTLTGRGFCHPAGGGSLIAVQIDAGRLARLDSTVDNDRTIWQIVEADDDGSFNTTVRVPEAHQTDPDFTDGSHRLRLLTGSLRAGDAIRSVRTGEFVVAPGNNAGVLPEPTSIPQPVKPDIALIGAKAGAVTAAKSGSTVRVVVPDLEPGDWVFPYAYSDRTDGADAQPVAWLQLDADRAVVLDAAAVAVNGATETRVSLQARDGTMVGWAPVVASNTGSATAAQAGAAGEADSDPEPAVHLRSPRPLVVIVGSVLYVVGFATLIGAWRQRRRALHEANDL
jgi:hypothetical protein